MLVSEHLSPIMKNSPLFRSSFVLINAGQSKGEEIIFQPFVLTWLISGTEQKQHIVYHSSDTALFLSYYFCSTRLHALCVLSHISTVKDWPRTFYSGQRSKHESIHNHLFSVI